MTEPRPTAGGDEPTPGEPTPGETTPGEAAPDGTPAPETAGEPAADPAAGSTPETEPTAEGGPETGTAGDAPADPFGAVSTEEIEAELARREQELDRLRRQRHSLQIQVAQLDRIIRELEGDLLEGAPGSAAPKGSSRPITDLPLAQAIARVYAIGDEFSPKDAVKRLGSAGYRTNAKTFGSMVAACLARERRFKRLGRGHYERIS